MLSFQWRSGVLLVMAIMVMVCDAQRMADVMLNSIDDVLVDGAVETATGKHDDDQVSPRKVITIKAVTRMAGGSEMEQCQGEGNGQCAEPPALSLPVEKKAESKAENTLVEEEEEKEESKEERPKESVVIEAIEMTEEEQMHETGRRVNEEDDMDQEGEREERTDVTGSMVDIEEMYAGVASAQVEGGGAQQSSGSLATGVDESGVTSSADEQNQYRVPKEDETKDVGDDKIMAHMPTGTSTAEDKEDSDEVSSMIEIELTSDEATGGAKIVDDAKIPHRAVEEPTSTRTPPPTQQRDHRSSRSTPTIPIQLPQSMALDAAARQLEQLQVQLREWLPVVEEITQRGLSEAKSVWRMLRELTTLLTHELSVVYHHFTAATTALFASAKDVCMEIWSTHEEIRVLARHVVSISLLLALGAAFFSIFWLVSTVPDFLHTVYRSLDDLTRAQLHVVSVLVVLVMSYQMRSLWSFWIVVVAVAVYYYWSGHVVVDIKLRRPPSH